MYFKFYILGQFDSGERAILNGKVVDFVVYMSGRKPPKFSIDGVQNFDAPKMSAEQKKSRPSKSLQQKTKLSDLRAERIPGAVEPRIGKPKNNIFDKANNEKLLKEFLDAGLKVESETDDATNAN